MYKSWILYMYIYSSNGHKTYDVREKVLPEGIFFAALIRALFGRYNLLVNEVLLFF